MPKGLNVLIGGGSGFVGRHLVQILRQSGAKTRIITRRATNKNEHVSWNDIKHNGLPKDTNAVVNLAGKNIFSPQLWLDGFKKEIYDSRIGTNKILRDAIHSACSQGQPIGSFVTVSGVGYYEPHAEREYDESWQQSQASQHDYLMRLAADWEKASELDENQALDCRRVVIRAGVVLGRDGGVAQSLKIPFLMFAGGSMGSGEQWFPWIHVHDLAEMFKFALVNQHVTGAINGVAPQQVRYKEFASAFGAALSRPALINMPELVVKLMWGPDRAQVLLNGQRMKSRAGLLGFRYAYTDIAKACSAAV